MRKTRPGIDRQTVVAARSQVATAKHELDRHTQHCLQCKHAGSDVYDHCSAWWSIATALHRFRRKLKRLETPEQDEQEPLPGM